MQFTPILVYTWMSLCALGRRLHLLVLGLKLSAQRVGGVNPHQNDGTKDAPEVRRRCSKTAEGADKNLVT